MSHKIAKLQLRHPNQKFYIFLNYFELFYFIKWDEFY